MQRRGPEESAAHCVIDQTRLRNMVLRSLSPEDFSQLGRRLERVSLHQGQRIGTAGLVVQHAYFLEDGFVTFAVPLVNRELVDFGIVGREGITSFSAFRAEEASPVEIIARVDGVTAHRISAQALRALAIDRPTLRTALDQTVYQFMQQMAFVAISNSRHRLHQRTARLLLMCLDRITGTTFSVTHELMARMLGTQRTSLTTTLHEIEGLGAIRNQRKSVEVVSRACLETIADGAYGDFLRLTLPEFGDENASSDHEPSGAPTLRVVADRKSGARSGWSMHDGFRRTKPARL